MSVNTDVRKIFGNRITIFKQGSPYWNARFYKNNSKIQTSLKTTDESEAASKAEEWYLSVLTGKQPKDKIERVFPSKPEVDFRKASEIALNDYRNEGNYSESYIHGLQKLFNKLNEFIGYDDIRTIDNRAWFELKERIKKANPAISNRTLHQYKTGLKIVLNQAYRNRFIENPVGFVRERLPKDDTPRVSFSFNEYDKLFESLRKNIEDSKKNKSHHVRDCEELKDFCLFMAHTGMRVGECSNVRFCDVTFAKDKEGEYLEIRNILGKRGRGGVTKSYTGAPRAFRRILARHGFTENNYQQSTKSIWFSFHRDLFRKVLEKSGLRFTNDRPPKKRDFVSLRHTYILFALDRKQPVSDIAKNVRTSIEMIDRHYAKFFNILGNKNINKDYSEVD
jgi:integrase